MKRFICTLFVAFFLPSATPLSAEEEWAASAFSEATIAKINQETAVYHRCLSDQLATFRINNADSRDATNLLLKKCEAQLVPVRDTLIATNVAPAIADRYLLRKRHQAARKVLQLVMYAESQQRP